MDDETDIEAIPAPHSAAAAVEREAEVKPDECSTPHSTPHMIDSAVGDIKLIKGKYFVHTREGEVGFALYGPYWTLEPGYYSVAFKIMLPSDDHLACANHSTCCYLDVTAGVGSRVLFRKPVLASSLKAGGAVITLDFVIDELLKLEFRVYVTGAIPLIIEADRPVTRKYRYKFSPVLQSDNVDDEFFAEHFNSFRHFFEQGAKVSSTPKGTIISISKYKFYVKSTEDFQLIEEIFFHNMYNFISQHDAYVLDIGMNVGFASLYFAGMDYVKAVYSFEPFRAPFERALENFDLNPDLCAKIKPHNYGLGDSTRSLSVLYDEAHTIGTSIRGHGSGKETTIQIRDIAEVVSEVASEARSDGLDLVVKMDCEGSEFPICERLDAAGLLDQVQVFMIEWHKWWSGKTQHDIISRLIRCGFDVLDHTNPANPYAGELYAIRTNR